MTDTAPRSELTIRGLILGAALCVVFTAANVYVGLKAGLTFASSIPAAVISMAALRLFRGVTIQENNIVQTVASAAGALSSIIFVLPGLVMVGWWTGFPFWMSFGICAIGGTLGVMYSIPLRRALVTQSTLPYPEGVAAAEVLKVGSGGPAEGAAAAEGRSGLITMIVGSLASAGFAALVGMKLFAAQIAGYARFGRAASGMGAGFSLAIMGAGHLMGIAVGIALLVGLVITWGVAVPILTALHPGGGTAEAFATDIWQHKVRFIGAGAIGAAAIWTLGKLAAPIWRGLTSAMAASRLRAAGQGESLPRTELDIPIGIVAVVSFGLLIPMGWETWVFLAGGPLQGAALPLIAAALAYVVVAGFMVSAVCGYMAGLMGSSNSPVSGLAILAVLGAAVVLAAIARTQGWQGAAEALVAFALFITSILLAVAVVANDNLQDLKTGQLVDATPWRQQAALVVGVLAGAVVIPPILDLMNHAYGFAGAPNVDVIASNPLPAPQATLISTLAKGVIGGQLDWGLIGIGVLLGLALVAVDEALRRTGRYSLPPLGVGIAIYLPAAATVPAIIGATVGWAYDRFLARGPKAGIAKRMGVLLASGFIVGESLFNVGLAGLIVLTRKDEPLAVVGNNFGLIATILASLTFILVTLGLYLWTRARAERTPSAEASGAYA
ncbi:MAG TPA: oligopeptide transporter, OPT family [Caulobacteraceae bacterium]|nr:oligopeptide transporter, OPT family [Caulobacteraceae bacterium]